MGVRLTKNWTLKSDSENIRLQLIYIFLFYYFNNKEWQFQLKERISLNFFKIVATLIIVHKKCRTSDANDRKLPSAF